MTHPVRQSANHTDTRSRLERLVAGLRRRQLSTAVEGRVVDSMKYAQRVHRIRRFDRPATHVC